MPAGKVALCRHGAYTNGGHGPSQVMERLFPTPAAARQAASESGYDLPDPDGWTAVHQAVSRGNERLLRALLEHGGDRTARNAAGKTPLHLARAKGKAKIVAVLEE